MFLPCGWRNEKEHPNNVDPNSGVKEFFHLGLVLFWDIFSPNETLIQILVASKAFFDRGHVGFWSFSMIWQSKCRKHAVKSRACRLLKNCALPYLLIISEYISIFPFNIVDCAFIKTEFGRYRNHHRSLTWLQLICFDTPMKLSSSATIPQSNT